MAKCTSCLIAEGLCRNTLRNTTPSKRALVYQRLRDEDPTISGAPDLRG